MCAPTLVVSGAPESQLLVFNSESTFRISRLLLTFNSGTEKLILDHWNLIRFFRDEKFR